MKTADSAPASLGQAFAQSFDLVPACDFSRARIYQLRYRVFCEELGYGMTHRDGHESDAYDDVALHCLLHHRATSSDVGCVRLITPIPGRSGLPFESFGWPYVDRRLFDPDQVDLTASCEVSRLAVSPEFRRPILFSSDAGRSQRFPFGVVSLYYAVINLILAGGHLWAFMVAEPRLQRHLQRWGIVWRQISPEFEYFGQRAVFASSRQQLQTDVASWPAAWRDLYDTVGHQLSRPSQRITPFPS